MLRTAAGAKAGLGQCGRPAAFNCTYVPNATTTLGASSEYDEFVGTPGKRSPGRIKDDTYPQSNCDAPREADQWQEGREQRLPDQEAQGGRGTMHIHSQDHVVSTVVQCAARSQDGRAARVAGGMYIMQGAEGRRMRGTPRQHEDAHAQSPCRAAVDRFADAVEASSPSTSWSRSEGGLRIGTGGHLRDGRR